MAAAENPTRFDLPQDLVFVDLETTGGSPAYHRVIEVGNILYTPRLQRTRGATEDVSHGSPRI